ncbi:MAG: uracil-DNA glycosylase [Gammaproteobacteria bacterium]|nr:uracil-DNA glycosylase [Gammaproteobacteria bacterium]
MHFNREAFIARANVHAQWKDILIDALQSVDADYLADLAQSNAWLPGIDRIFSAFRRDRQNLRYILIGESPYPRAESANGIAFYDAAVDQLWSTTGLSKPVNRATSLRNIIKTALLAEGFIEPDSDGRIPQTSIARVDKSGLVQTMEDLFRALQERGFLMLNATPVLHSERKPALEAKYWQGFLVRLLELLAPSLEHPVTLVLWGKIAETIESLELSANYQKLKSEHPYNLSFIQNGEMQSLFREIAVLRKN